VTEAERKAALEAIGAEVAVCTRCRLHQTRTKAVPGEGTAATEVVFVGEGPGFNEDRQGKPFVGQAGALLTELLASVGWAREEVFITNVVKCRPPENRDPEPDEIAACAPFLTRQLAALDPAIVVTLGRFSMARFNPGARIGQVHGTFKAADPDVGAPQALTYAMYHPAAALRQASLRETLFRDMEGVPAALLEARRLRAERPVAVAAAESALPDPILSTHAAEPSGIGPEPGSVDSDPTDQLGLF
jgi:uracil-DNA glycosylase